MCTPVCPAGTNSFPQYMFVCVCIYVYICMTCIMNTYTHTYMLHAELIERRLRNYPSHHDAPLDFGYHQVSHHCMRVCVCVL